MLNIGKKFEDFSTLEIAIQQYQKEKNVQFFRRSSRTIEKAKPRMPDQKIDERLKHYEISFHCIRVGKNFKSRSTGMREEVIYLYLSIYLFVLQVMTINPASTLCRTHIGPPTKCHSNGISLAGRPWPAFLCLVLI